MRVPRPEGKPECNTAEPREKGTCTGGSALSISRSLDGGTAIRTGCGRSSGVEHNLAKVGVEGSNPFARSNEINHLRCCKVERPGSFEPPGAFPASTPRL